MSEKLSKMSAVDWHEQITTIAGPFYGNRKGWLSRAAHRAGITYRQVKSLYYGETDNPRHTIASNIISAAQRARLQEAKRDAAQLASIYASAASALDHIDPDFHRGSVDALLEAARILGAADCAGIKGGD